MRWLARPDTRCSGCTERVTARVRPGPQEEAFDVLRRHGLDVEWVLHPRGHGFPRDSLERIDGFVRRVVG